MRTALVCVALAGCSFQAGSTGAVGDSRGSGSSGSDGGGSATIDAAACFGAGAYQICLNTLPSGDLDLGGVLATDLDSKCNGQPMWAAAQPDVCFISAHNIHVTGQTLQVRGTRPLVLLATGTIVVDSDIDAASHKNLLDLGPGGDPNACNNPSGPGGSSNGGGGGAGGSFMTKGGKGGKGDGGSTGGGGAAGPDAAQPAILRGGCKGGDGGDGGGNNTRGRGGYGGGAVFLVAGTSITINQTINVSGAGGSGGSSRAGGGGGGSGGMLVLYAPSIANSGALMANGGGGAAGADNADGPDGHDPDPASPTSVANGGTGNDGGNGGNGYANSIQATDGLQGAGGGSSGGGGGGGGGAGFILVNVAPGGTITPPATMM